LSPAIIKLEPTPTYLLDPVVLVYLFPQVEHNLQTGSSSCPFSEAQQSLKEFD
jgi:hypothetical protein